MLFGFDEPAADTAAPGLDVPVEPEPDIQSRSRWWLVVPMVAAAMIVAVLIAWLGGSDTAADTTQTDIDDAVAQALADAAEEPAIATQVYNQISPSLVIIRATDSDSVTDADQEGDDESPTPGTMLGSGVIISEDGRVMTANHVIDGASSIELIFADGTRSVAEVAATEPEMDIAILEAETRPGVVVPAVMGNSRTVRIGDDIFAVGNPLGLAGSLSSGVVSSLGRNIPFGDDDATLDGLIQFDAAVNQGSSGGPLLNQQGQVIGIVTALADPSEQGFFVGIGFAVPIDIAAGGAAGGPSQ